MNINKFSIPLALAAIFGAANSASAATFPDGTAITFTQNVFQINASGGTLDGVTYPSIAPEFNGGADGLFDLLAGVTTIDGNPTLSPTNRVINAPVSAGNVLLAVGATPTGYHPTIDSKGDNKPGNPQTATLGLAAVGSNTFGIPFDDLAYNVSADGVLPSQLMETSGMPSYLFTVYDPDTSSVTHEFALTEITTFCYNPVGGLGLNIGFGPLFAAGCAEGVFAFEADGFVENEGDRTPGKWAFNGVGFLDDGNGGDQVANDGVTRLTGNDIAFVVDVPEPSALLGLASILGLGAFGKRKKQR